METGCLKDVAIVIPSSEKFDKRYIMRNSRFSERVYETSVAVLQQRNEIYSFSSFFFSSLVFPFHFSFPILLLLLHHFLLFLLFDLLLLLYSATPLHDDHHHSHHNQ